mmetsp:Transcript_82895/g.239511  ORF Transcript_82895/g.239511 Transcript_82895/m.239511 type:complete len:241 (-) Transcript_82895:136-858(-)
MAFASLLGGDVLAALRTDLDGAQLRDRGDPVGEAALDLFAAPVHLPRQNHRPLHRERAPLWRRHVCEYRPGLALRAPPLHQGEPARQGRERLRRPLPRLCFDRVLRRCLAALRRGARCCSRRGVERRRSAVLVELDLRVPCLGDDLMAFRPVRLQPVPVHGQAVLPRCARRLHLLLGARRRALAAVVRADAVAPGQRSFCHRHQLLRRSIPHCLVVRHVECQDRGSRERLFGLRLDLAWH